MWTEGARVAMESACKLTAKTLQLRAPRTPQSTVAMVLSLSFHTKDPEGLGDAVNIFLFTYLSPYAGSEAALMACKRDAVLWGYTLTSFADTNFLMVNQKVSPVTGWDEAVSQLEERAVICTVLLGDVIRDPDNLRWQP